MTHMLEPTQYLYRGHLITRATNPDHGMDEPSPKVIWQVTDEQAGAPLYTGDGVDECTAAIDEVLDDIEDPRDEYEAASLAEPSHD